MGMNKETQRSMAAIVDKELYEKFKKICAINKRSVSNQLALLIEQFVKKSSK